MRFERPEEPSHSYAIRYTPRARRELIEAALRFGELAGTAIADEWAEGFIAEIARLATSPRQFPQVPEQNSFKRETRHLVYRRPGSSVSYRAIYVIEDMSDDGPIVTIIHFRHAAARPILRKSAREIETGEA